MYGQMTAGSWIYIGSPGHRAGHLRDLRRGRPPALRRRPQGPLDPDRRPRRHGRRPAARRGHGRRLAASPSSATPTRSTSACAPATSTRRRRQPRRGAGDDRALDQGRRGEVGRRCSATPPTSSPSWCAAASAPTSSPTRPPRTIRSTATCRRAGRMAEWRARRESDPKAVERAARASMKVHVAAMVDFWNARHPDARLRQQHPPDGAGGGARERLRLPGLRAGLHPAAVLPRHRPVPLGALSGDPEDIYAHRRQGEGADPRRSRTCTTGSTWRASASPSRACRRASAGSASASATGSGSPSTRWCAPAS